VVSSILQCYICHRSSKNSHRRPRDRVAITARQSSIANEIVEYIARCRPCIANHKDIGYIEFRNNIIREVVDKCIMVRDLK